MYTTLEGEERCESLICLVQIRLLTSRNTFNRYLRIDPKANVN
jgi:hypothetical protein